MAGGMAREEGNCIGSEDDGGVAADEFDEIEGSDVADALDWTELCGCDVFALCCCVRC